MTIEQIDAILARDAAMWERRRPTMTEAQHTEAIERMRRWAETRRDEQEIHT